MTVRAEDFYGSAVNVAITGDITIDYMARVMRFSGSSGGVARVGFKDGLDFAKRMDYTWLGGPVCYFLNDSNTTLDVAAVINGQECEITLGPSENAILLAVDVSNKVPNALAFRVGALETKNWDPKIDRATSYMQVIEGVVHNGGSPGGTGVERLAMPAGTWSAGSASPNNHGDAAGWSIGQAFHLVGHNAGTTIRQRHSRFQANAWVTRTDFPFEQENAMAAGLDDAGFVFTADIGQTLANKPLSMYENLDKSDSYAVKAAMPHAAERGGATPVAAWDRIGIIRGDPLLQASWLYHKPSGTYESIDFYAGVTKRSMSCLTVFGKVYCCGGYDDNGVSYFDTTDIFDIATRSWSIGPTLPAERREGASLAWKQVGIYAGGDDNTGTPSNVVFRTNVTSSWFTTTAKTGANTNSGEQGGTAR